MEIEGTNRAERLAGTDGSDDIYGFGGDDVLIGGRGDDELYGFAGNDVLDGGRGDDELTGGSGNDVFRYASGHDEIEDFRSGDVIELGTELGVASLADVLAVARSVDGGDDTLLVFGTDHTLWLEDVARGSLNAAMFGFGATSGAAPVQATASSSSWHGESSSRADGDRWDGDGDRWSDDDDDWYDDRWDGSGRDSFSGSGSSRGSSTPSAPLREIDGTGGPDVIAGTPGGDEIDGFGGPDRISGRGGDDEIDGGWGRDRLFGGLGDDELDGDGGNDLLRGGPGDDYLDGDGGNDLLVGGADDDILNGGRGRDVFIYSGGDDVIEDFAANETIRIASALGIDSFAALLAAAAPAGGGDDVRITFGADDTLLLEDVRLEELAPDDFLFV